MCLAEHHTRFGQPVTLTRSEPMSAIFHRTDTQTTPLIASKSAKVFASLTGGSAPEWSAEKEIRWLA
jgi:hypothetical protein